MRDQCMQDKMTPTTSHREPGSRNQPRCKQFNNNNNHNNNNNNNNNNISKAPFTNGPKALFTRLKIQIYNKTLKKLKDN